MKHKNDPNQVAATIAARVTGLPPPTGVYAALIKRLEWKKLAERQLKGAAKNTRRASK